MKSTLKSHRDKLKALFAQHTPPTQEPPKDEPPTEDAPTVGPEPLDPEIDHKALTEEVAKQVGYRIGDQVTGVVTNRQMVNRHYLWALVPDWSEQVLVAVHDQGEWPAGSRIKCQYVQANSDGHLVFNTKERGPKWKRRGAR